MHTFIFIIVAIIAILCIREARGTATVLSNWQHSFDQFQFSPKNFYQAVEQAIKKRQIPGVSFSRVTQVQTHILSERREYLRVEYGDFTFDICAGHFGNGSYVSWWFSERPSIWKAYLRSNPRTKDLADVHTYYQDDSWKTYKDIIHACVLEAIDSITTNKGLRLSEFDRRVNDTDVK